MQVGDPEEEIVKVAQAGIRGMVGALGRETISPHVMIDAALHVLAAWVASSQVHSPLMEREEEVDELLDVLPSYIEYQAIPRSFTEHMPGLGTNTEFNPLALLPRLANQHLRRAFKLAGRDRDRKRTLLEQGARSNLCGRPSNGLARSGDQLNSGIPGRRREGADGDDQ